MKKVLVRVGKKDYEVPQETRWHGRLVMVTENPSEKEELLVWRLDRKPFYTELSARVGSLSSGKIEERVETAAVAHYDVYKRPKAGSVSAAHYDVYKDSKIGDVWHMLVSPKLRRKTVGAAMREMIIREMKGAGAEYITFPYHKESAFYTGRGMRPLPNPSQGPGTMRYGGRIAELGVKPKGIKLKVLWKKANPRLSR